MKGTKKKPLPSPPITPTIKSITLDYKSSAVISVKDNHSTEPDLIEKQGQHVKRVDIACMVIRETDDPQSQFVFNDRDVEHGSEIPIVGGGALGIGPGCQG